MITAFVFGFVIGLLVGAIWMAGSHYNRYNRFTSDDSQMFPPPKAGTKV